MKFDRSSRIFAAALLMTLTAGCGSTVTGTAAPAAETDGAASVDRVTAGLPQRKDLQLFTTQPAWIEAYERTPLFPKVSGYVAEVLVDIGDPVKQGEALLKISLPELVDELEQQDALVVQAEAEIGQAQAELEAAQAAVTVAEARIAQAEAGIVRASAEYERWAAEHARIKELAANRSVTGQLLDETSHQLRGADAGRLEAAAAVASAKAALREAEAGERTAVADHKAAAARKLVAEANRAYAQTMLDYGTINAPFDGVITERHVDTGHLVNPSAAAARPLLVVARINRLRVFVDVPEMEAAHVDSGEAGDAATIHIPGQGNRKLTGQVTRTGVALDPANRSLRTEIDIDNADGVVRPGAYATVAILLADRQDALTLPASAIIHEGDDTLCCVVKSGKIVRTPVETGLRSANDVEILAGIHPEDQVVLVRAAGLKQDQSVEVIPAKNP